ncbi:hypothetical protein RJT34_19894 [Clitoria ternatea]|uniref:Auxin-induced protein n=1 Tax=Clitoria ternatea TaxID=43366 RepID=A0AAN9IS13_CLITE
MTSSVMEAERNKYSMINFEETELRLGLPLGPNEGLKNTSTGKRGFSDTTVDLKLNLSSSSNVPEENITATKSTAKAQVVGWPPVRSFRKKIVNVQKSNKNESANTSNNNGALVKVSMDGAPYLRKVDLNLYKSYQDLSHALAPMFSSFTVDTKFIDLLNGSDYVPTYEDRDGDWLLIGDVPWEMFVESCKRLRIMKGSEAKGLAPRAVEKCKNRS